MEFRYNPNQIANIDRFGFASVLSIFNPHITIGNIGNDDIDLSTIEKCLMALLKDTLSSDVIL